MPALPRSLLLPSLLLFSTIARAQDPVPENVGISEIIHGGSGCPQGSVATYISEDKQAMTLIFDRYSVQVGAGQSARESKSCNIKLKLTAPAGWSYGIVSADFRGYANLDAGVIGEQSATYRFGPARWAEAGTMRMTGALSADYINSTNSEDASIQWSPCNRDKTPQIDLMTQITISKFVAQSIDYAKLRQTANKMTNSIELVLRLAQTHPKLNPVALAAIKAMHTASQNLTQAASKQAAAAELNSALTAINQNWSTLRSATVARRNRRGFSALVHIKKFEFSLSEAAALINPASERSQGLLTMDTADTELKHEYGLQWRKCSDGPGRGNGRPDPRPN
jgi:hypothetical protein